MKVPGIPYNIIAYIELDTSGDDSLMPGNHGVIVCEVSRPNKKEFVTWNSVIPSEGRPTFLSGHYTESRDDAIKEAISRAVKVFPASVWAN